MTEDLRLWAVRGATRAGANDPEKVVEATQELMRELMSRNELPAERMVSCIFTSTQDLNAEFPAAAARALGLEAVPLLCAQEIDVPGSMRGVVRVLVHYYGPPDRDPVHTYLGEAQELRNDLKSAQ
jgi:chorismate mutase